MLSLGLLITEDGIKKEIIIILFNYYIMENKNEKLVCTSPNTLSQIPEMPSCKIKVLMCVSIGIFVVFLFIIYKYRKINVIKNIET